MPRLSNKRKTHALLFGEAVARDLMKDYVENPSYFGGNLDSLMGLAGRFARSGLGINSAWEVTDQERDIAEVSAIQSAILYIRVAERYAASCTGQSLEDFLVEKHSSP